MIADTFMRIYNPRGGPVKLFLHQDVYRSGYEIFCLNVFSGWTVLAWIAASGPAQIIAGGGLNKVSPSKYVRNAKQKLETVSLKSLVYVRVRRR